MTDVLSATVSAAIGFTIGGFIYLYLTVRKRAKEAASPPSEEEFRSKVLELRYSGRFKWAPFAWLMVLFFLALLVYTGISTEATVSRREQARIIVVWYLIMCTIAWYSFIVFYKPSVRISDAGIEKPRFLRRGFTVGWNEVESISYPWWLEAFVVKTAKGTLIVGRNVDCLDYFIKIAKAKVPESKWVRSLPERVQSRWKAIMVRTNPPLERIPCKMERKRIRDLARRRLPGKPFSYSEVMVLVRLRRALIRNRIALDVVDIRSLNARDEIARKKREVTAAIQRLEATEKEAPGRSTKCLRLLKRYSALLAERERALQ